VVLAAAGFVAVLASGGDEAAEDQIDQADPVRVAGDPLPALGDGADPAVGLIAPRLDGSGFVGQPVSVVPGDGAKAVMFLAHWCPHCQAEVPVVTDWLADGGLPDSVELVSVSTSIDPDLPNYPPQDWLASEGWPARVLVDGDDSAAAAYGVGGFPFWAFLNADGTVSSRVSGEMPVEDLQARIDAIAG